MSNRRIFLEDIPLEEARAKLQAALERAGRATPPPASQSRWTRRWAA